MRRVIGHEDRDCGMQKRDARSTSVSLKNEKDRKYMKRITKTAFGSDLP